MTVHPVADENKLHIATCLHGGFVSFSKKQASLVFIGKINDKINQFLFVVLL